LIPIAHKILRNDPRPKRSRDRRRNERGHAPLQNGSDISSLTGFIKKESFGQTDKIMTIVPVQRKKKKGGKLLTLIID
jgi:hypothetical protein